MCLTCLTNGVSNPSRRHFLKTAGKIIAGAAALSLYANIQAQSNEEPKYKVEEVLRNGPNEKRFDIVFLPEGYTKDMQKQFDKDVESALNAYDTFDALKETKPLFNFHKIWIVSDKKWTKDTDGTGTVFGTKCKDNTVELVSTKKMTELNTFAKTDIPCIVIPDGIAGRGGSVGMATSPYEAMFAHELGHVMGLGDEYADFGVSNIDGINVTRDEKNPPWKELLEKKIKGIKTQKVEGFDNYFKGEDFNCIMDLPHPEYQFGPLCTSGILFRLRGYLGILESHPETGKPLELKKGDKKGLEFKVLPTNTHTPVVQAWYSKGSAEEMDKLAEKLGEGTKQKPEDFADKKVYTPMTLNADKKDKTKLTLDTSKLAEGSYTVFTRTYDPNPAIILDPSQESIQRYIYRLEIKK